MPGRSIVKKAAIPLIVFLLSSGAARAEQWHHFYLANHSGQTVRITDKVLRCVKTLKMGGSDILYPGDSRYIEWDDSNNALGSASNDCVNINKFLAIQLTFSSNNVTQYIGMLHHTGGHVKNSLFYASRVSVDNRNRLSHDDGAPPDFIESSGPWNDGSLGSAACNNAAAAGKPCTVMVSLSRSNEMQDGDGMGTNSEGPWIISILPFK